MDPESYIAQYGHTLSEADKRYIRAFGAPQFSPGPAANPSTPGIRIGSYNEFDSHDGTNDDDEAEEWEDG